MPEAPYGAIRTRHYDATTIALHWTTAVLVMVLWISAHAIDWFGHATETLIRSSHIVLGVALAMVLLTRLGWRIGSGRALPAADRGAVHIVAKLTHYALYTLLVVTLILGIANSLAHGSNIFDLVQLPKIDFGNTPWPHHVRGWHALAANAILVVAGFHAAAALFHHYVWNDGVLARMLPASRD